jgi:hypothetical protein
MADLTGRRGQFVWNGFTGIFQVLRQGPDNEGVNRDIKAIADASAISSMLSIGLSDDDDPEEKIQKRALLSALAYHIVNIQSCETDVGKDDARDVSVALWENIGDVIGGGDADEEEDKDEDYEDIVELKRVMIELVTKSYGAMKMALGQPADAKEDDVKQMIEEQMKTYDSNPTKTVAVSNDAVMDPPRLVDNDEVMVTNNAPMDPDATDDDDDDDKGEKGAISKPLLQPLGSSALEIDESSDPADAMPEDATKRKRSSSPPLSPPPPAATSTLPSPSVRKPNGVAGVDVDADADEEEQTEKKTKKKRRNTESKPKRTRASASAASTKASAEQQARVIRAMHAESNTRQIEELLEWDTQTSKNLVDRRGKNVQLTNTEFDNVKRKFPFSNVPISARRDKQSEKNDEGAITSQLFTYGNESQLQTMVNIKMVVPAKEELVKPVNGSLVVLGDWSKDISKWNARALLIMLHKTQTGSSMWDIPFLNPLLIAYSQVEKTDAQRFESAAVRAMCVMIQAFVRNNFTGSVGINWIRCWRILTECFFVTSDAKHRRVLPDTRTIVTKLQTRQSRPYEACMYVLKGLNGTNPFLMDFQGSASNIFMQSDTRLRWFGREINLMSRAMQHVARFVHDWREDEKSPDDQEMYRLVMPYAGDRDNGKRNSGIAKQSYQTMLSLFWAMHEVMYGASGVFTANDIFPDERQSIRCVFTSDEILDFIWFFYGMRRQKKLPHTGKDPDVVDIHGGAFYDSIAKEIDNPRVFPDKLRRAIHSVNCRLYKSSVAPKSLRKHCLSALPIVFVEYFHLVQRICMDIYSCMRADGTFNDAMDPYSTKASNHTSVTMAMNLTPHPSFLIPAARDKVCTQAQGVVAPVAYRWWDDLDKLKLTFLSVSPVFITAMFLAMELSRKDEDGEPKTLLALLSGNDAESISFLTVYSALYTPICTKCVDRYPDIPPSFYLLFDVRYIKQEFKNRNTQKIRTAVTMCFGHYSELVGKMVFAVAKYSRERMALSAYKDRDDGNDSDSTVSDEVIEVDNNASIPQSELAEIRQLQASLPPVGLSSVMMEKMPVVKAVTVEDDDDGDDGMQSIPPARTSPQQVRIVNSINISSSSSDDDDAEEEEEKEEEKEQPPPQQQQLQLYEPKDPSRQPLDDLERFMNSLSIADTAEGIINLFQLDSSSAAFRITVPPIIGGMIRVCCLPDPANAQRPCCCPYSCPWKRDKKINPRLSSSSESVRFTKARHTCLRCSTPDCCPWEPR